MTIDNNDNDNDNNNHYCSDQHDHVTEINFGSVSGFGGLAPQGRSYGGGGGLGAGAPPPHKFSVPTGALHTQKIMHTIFF